MEDPATWGQAEKVVNEAIHQHAKAMSKGIIGLSHTRQITDALRAAGLLKEGE